MDSDLAAFLSRARRGGIQEFGDQGPEGSANWSPGQPIPACLLLHDLEAGRELESAALADALVELGSRVGVKMPTLTRVSSLLSTLDKTRGGVARRHGETRRRGVMRRHGETRRRDEAAWRDEAA